jgi:uncharacterized GH25 family protein
VRRIALLIAVALTLVLSGFAGAKDDKPSAQIDFTVLREGNGKPVRSASVILHAVDKNGKQGKDAYEVKTDSEGRVTLSGLEYGKYRIQVLAEHLQTYGDDLEIRQPTQEMTIKLKPPQKQYTIY